MAHLKDLLSRAWAADLAARVPGHAVYPSRRPDKVKPPFSVVVVGRMDQAAPGSDAWIAEVKVVCVCDKAEGGSAEQERRLGEISEAVEATVAGADADLGVRLCGFSVDEVRQAKAEHVYSDVMFITAGCERVASAE